MSFKLLFRKRPWGLLNIAKESSEEQPSPFHLVIKYVCETQEWIEVQAKQNRIYTQPAQLQEFQPGDLMLLLLPTANCKFLTRWQGPHTEVVRVDPVNYRLQQPSKRSVFFFHHLIDELHCLETYSCVFTHCITHFHSDCFLHRARHLKVYWSSGR